MCALRFWNLFFFPLMPFMALSLATYLLSLTKWYWKSWRDLFIMDIPFICLLNLLGNTFMLSLRNSVRRALCTYFQSYLVILLWIILKTQHQLEICQNVQCWSQRIIKTFCFPRFLCVFLSSFSLCYVCFTCTFKL